MQTVLSKVAQKLLDRPLLVIGILVGAILVLTGIVLAGLSLRGLSGADLTGAIAIPLMILLGAASRVPQRFSGGDIGIELCMLFMLCTILKVGLGAGLLVGLGGMVLSAFLTKEPPQDVAVAILGFGVIGLMASAFGLWGDVLVMGVVYTFVYDLLTGGAYLLMGHTPFGVAKFALTHIVWNFVVFRALGQWLLAIL